MSEIAEFAQQLHESVPRQKERRLESVEYQALSDRLTDVRAVIFDVYGTILDYWRNGMDDEQEKQTILLNACRKTAERFGFIEYLNAMNPPEAPEKTLYDLYNGLIALRQQQAVQKGASLTEVRVEDIWNIIVLMLARYGYDSRKCCPEINSDDLARCIAYVYNFHSLGRGLYPGVVQSLKELRRNNIALGILSNAQFYTPMDLSLLFRDQSSGEIEDFNELFDPDLTIFSYEYGVAKPDTALFRKLFDALYERNFLPAQTVFAGNDLMIDIEPASQAGMRTALFTGDCKSVYFHGREGVVFPDIVFSAWEELPRKISFYGEEAGTR